MNAKIKKRWLAALRSGEYEQGKYSLKHNRGGTPRYCCLGVLCDLYGKETDTPWEESPLGNTYQMAEAVAVLPDRVVAWAELTDEESPRLDPGTVRLGDYTADALNDSGNSFLMIATEIEKYL